MVQLLHNDLWLWDPEWMTSAMTWLAVSSKNSLVGTSYIVLYDDSVVQVFKRTSIESRLIVYITV
jgi:hypothetical protein